MLTLVNNYLLSIPVTLHVRVQETNESEQSAHSSIEYAISVQDQLEGT